MTMKLCYLSEPCLAKVFLTTDWNTIFDLCPKYILECTDVLCLGTKSLLAILVHGSPGESEH